MTVFTKLIHGDLHVKTFELMDETGPVRRARVITDKICTASTTIPSNSFTSSSNQHSSPSAHPPSPALTHASEPYSTETIFKIFPSDGPNLHSYSAVSDYAIIVDIMGPPYAIGEREITYFKEVPLSNNNTTTEFVVENGSTPSSAALFDSFSSSSSSSDSCIPTTGSVKRKRSETGLSDDAADQVVAKKQTSSSQNSNSSTVVSTFNQHYCRKGALVSPTNSAKSFDDMCSAAKCIHESNGGSNASFCQLQVDPSGEMEVTEKEYQGLPVRDFLKLLEIAHLNGKDRVVETLKICDRIGKTFDRLVASLVVAQS
ncbi:hypothetical protein HDU79_008010 [Rhizoclosmatium sp. JEL0117]|nr:hypothetical protein HDU79_008010 [Rhizoclosmatium sp. JEL0117]